jgi:ectoine hydroxylase-related dioxygenase (phytanoyl-CoA dioxygenase family)
MVQQPITRRTPAYFNADDINIADFDALCSQTVDLGDYPLASDAQQKILIYSGDALRDVLAAGRGAEIRAELARALKDGPGVLVIQRGYANTDVIDRSTALFREIVADEKAGKSGKGDHFGNNERIWNVIQKVCERDPELFIDYYSNAMIALVCEAWLGPGYQISAQMNTVKPGNKAQSAHRDYHLGFQSSDVVDQFPAHAQVMSQYLTLQGAIAHGDMPLESGPTRLLPFSQHYEPGYLAYTMPEFVDYFANHAAQLPLRKGDLVFFSPALFHGAGSNASNNDRVANLIQISSAFGRTMETINTSAMAKRVYPALLGRVQAGSMGARAVHDTVAAVADGYSFPTNLDSDPPIGGNAPQTAQQIMHQALTENWTPEQFNAAIDARDARRQA